MGGEGTNGSDELLRRVLDAARELSRHDDPAEAMRVALDHGRKILRVDRSLFATQRQLQRPAIRVTRSDAPGTAFHDPVGQGEPRLLDGGLLAELLYAGEARLIDEVAMECDDPSGPYLIGMQSLAAIPQYQGGEAVDMVFHLRRDKAAFRHDRFAERVLISSLFGQSLHNLSRARDLAEAERSIKEQYDIISKLSTTVLNSAMDLKDYSKVLEERVRERTAELHDANLDAIYMLALASEAKDQDTGDHLRRIEKLTCGLALELGMDNREASALGHAAILHDIGKMHIPDSVLKKPGALTDEERSLMQEHTIVGERILGSNAHFESARRIARSHHENFDGSGYPDRIVGEQIPLEARIVHLADVFDALVSPRVYKPAWPREKAVGFIKEASGSMFDPEVVRAFDSTIRVPVQ